MKKFVNYTDEDFTHKWDGKAFTFKAGKEIYLEDHLAEHFAKHLAEREMLKDGKEDFIDVEKQEYIDKIIISEEETEEEIEDIPDIKSRTLNKNAKLKELKEVKEVKTIEDEFEGLNADKATDKATDKAETKK